MAENLTLGSMRLAHRTKTRRRLSGEKLDVRQLCAGDVTFRFDVNLDGNVSPIDALSVVNDISRNGLRPVINAVDEVMDVNRDQFVSSLDALVVVNQIDREPWTETIDAETLRLDVFSRNPPGARLANSPDELEDLLDDPPAIDFATESVVAFFSQAFPSSGYLWNLVRATKTPNSAHATVTLELDSPAPEDVVLTVITRPEIIVKLDAAIESVTFIDTGGNVLASASA